MEIKQERRKAILQYIIKSTAFTLIASGLVFYLVSPDGLFWQYWKLDLSFLLLPITGYLVLRLSARLSEILLELRTGLLVSFGLNYAAFAWFSYFFLSRIIFLSHISILRFAQGFLFDVSHTAVYSALLLTGYLITRLSGFMSRSYREQPIYPAVTALGQVLIGFSYWKIFAAFTSYWSGLNGVGLILMAGMLTVAATYLGAYGKNSSRPVLNDFFFWLEDAPAGKFILGAIIASYFVFIRPFIFTYSPYAFLVEWVIICFTAWLILTAMSNSLQKRHTAPIIESMWQRHIQEVNDIADEDFNRLTIFQEYFVEAGIRKHLMIYLQQMLRNNGLNDNEISEALKQIIEYSDRKIPWYARWIWRRRIQNMNRERRQQALDNMVQNLVHVTHPYQKSRRIL